mgnify:FL=1
MSLQRFEDAHRQDYETALAEIRRGRKTSHWMWYIFPQLKGLGYSPTAQYYGIENLAEAEAFLAHPVLGAHLVEISRTLLALETDNADLVFGYPDNLKLRSSMTLFAQIREADPVFGQVLDKFFDGKPDQRTLELLKE